MPLNSLTRQLQPYFFCLLLCTNLNIMAALFIHQAYGGAQKNDSREGLF